jgi:hypothetical protein
MTDGPIYWTDHGPPDGPYPHDRRGAAIGVYPDRSCPIPKVGIAYHVGSVARRGGRVGVYWLDVPAVDPADRWIVVGRRFVRLGDGADVVTG